MPFNGTEDQKFKVQLFRDSVRLQDPAVETDPAYKFTDEQLWTILEIVTPAHFEDETADSVKNVNFYYPLLLAKREIYYRLATSTAPFYPLEAEGASLEKNVRFDHYLALVKQVETEYNNAMKRKLAEQEREDGLIVDGTAQTYEVTVLSHYYSRRNYRGATRPVVSLSLSGETSSSVNVDWTPVNELKPRFTAARIYISSAGPIIDDYAENVFPERSADYYTTDVHRTKCRLSNLKADTEYHIAIVIETLLGPKGYDQKTFKTLP